MPNMFGGPQDHPAYDDRRELNPKTEFMLGNTLYTLGADQVIEAQGVDGAVERFFPNDSTLPNAVRDHFQRKA